MEPNVIKGKVKTTVAETPLAADAKADAKERRISGYANKPVKDRVGDIVEVEAFFGTMDAFMKNPVMLLYHNPTRPVGGWDGYELRQDGLWMSGTLAPSGVQDADEAWVLIRHGHLRGLSIGFRELENGGGVEDDGNYHIRRLELLETSIVSIPANQEALFQMDKSGGKVLSVTLLPEQPIKTLTGIDFEAIREAGLLEIADRFEKIELELSKGNELVSQIDTLKATEEAIDRRLADAETCISVLRNTVLEMLKRETKSLQGLHSRSAVSH